MRPLWVTAIAGSVLALSACGGGAEPPEAAPPSSSGTPSESPSESGTPEAEVTLPAALRGTSTQAAKATVQYFIEEGNQAIESGETTKVRQVFDDRCTSCESLFSNIEKIYSDGGYLKGTSWADPRFTKALPIRDPERVGYIVQVEQGAQTTVLSEGAEPKKFAGNSIQYLTFTLEKGDAGWTIVTLLVGTDPA